MNYELRMSGDKEEIKKVLKEKEPQKPMLPWWMWAAIITLLIIMFR